LEFIYSKSMATIFVDLDKTLITKNSSTIELIQLVSLSNPNSFKKLIVSFFSKSRAAVKESLTDLSPEIDFSKYYSSTVLSILASAKRENKRIVLATGAMEVTARRVISSYPIEIDHYLTSTKDIRNKGKQKLDSIQHWNGNTPQTPFAYIGDAYIDLIIMKHASESYFVGHRSIFLIGKYIKRIRNISYCPNKRISRVND